MRKLTAKLGAVVTVGVLAAAILPASPASALGNNRTVNRGCGSNYVASGFSAAKNNTTWSQTSKAGGSCDDTLSTAVERWTGQRTLRVYGSKTNAYIEDAGWAPANHGIHWGCNSCNETLS